MHESLIVISASNTSCWAFEALVGKLDYLRFCKSPPILSSKGRLDAAGFTAWLQPWYWEWGIYSLHLSIEKPVAGYQAALVGQCNGNEPVTRRGITTIEAEEATASSLFYLDCIWALYGPFIPHTVNGHYLKNYNYFHHSRLGLDWHLHQKW